MQIILNWLQSQQQNFTVGATLYKTFGKDEVFKKLLLQGETTAVKELLIDRLQQMVQPVKTPRREFLKYLGFTTIQATAIAAPPVVSKETSEMPGADEEVLQAIRNEWQPLYQRMNLLRHNLDKYGSDNSEKAIAFRGPIAAEIKKLEKQCNAIWAKHDYYIKEGKLPFGTEKKVEIPTDPVKLAMLINNIKKSIRTNRKLMKQHPGNPKYAELYSQYKAKHKLVTGNEYEEKES